MLLLVRGFGWGVSKAAVLLFLRMQRRVPDTLGRLDSPSLDTLVKWPWFDQGPLVQGRYSFVGGCSRSSTVLEGDGPAPSGHRIICSRSRTGDSVCCWGMDSAGRGPSI